MWSQGSRPCCSRWTGCSSPLLLLRFFARAPVAMAIYPALSAAIHPIGLPCASSAAPDLSASPLCQCAEKTAHWAAKVHCSPQQLPDTDHWDLPCSATWDIVERLSAHCRGWKSTRKRFASSCCEEFSHMFPYLRAAAPAADPGKEKPVMVSAGFVRVFCESSAWMLYIYIIYIYIYMHQIVYTCMLK